MDVQMIMVDRAPSLNARKSSSPNCISARMVTPGRSPANDANPHDIIEFSVGLIQNVFAISAPLYKKGLSLREIALQTGFSKAHIRKELIHGGVSLRESSRETGGSDWRKFGKKNVKPPYGFCYLEGRILPQFYCVLAEQKKDSIADEKEVVLEFRYEHSGTV